MIMSLPDFAALMMCANEALLVGLKPVRNSLVLLTPSPSKSAAPPHSAQLVVPKYWNWNVTKGSVGTTPEITKSICFPTVSLDIEPLAAPGKGARVSALLVG